MIDIKEDIKKMELTDIQYIFDKLTKFYDYRLVNAWKKRVLNDINSLFVKYKVIDSKINKNSYMGIVIDCFSSCYGNIFIKIVPPMIERFTTEVNTLKLLPKELTCKILEIDMDKKALVMGKIMPGDLVNFYDSREIIKDVFQKLYMSKIEINEDIDQHFKDFLEVVTNDYNICKNRHYNTQVVDKLYAIFVNEYKDICKNQKKYLLHGDVYKNNIIRCHNSAQIIDPLGFKAPFIIELLPICAYEMFYNTKDNEEILNDFTNFFSDYVDKNYYKKALLCQLIKIYIPSLYEANDGGTRAHKWLEIIIELYPQILDMEKVGS